MNAKYNISDRLIGEDWNDILIRRGDKVITELVEYHWEVRDITKRYYSLWNYELRITKLFPIEEIDGDFELDIVAMRKLKLEKLKSLEK